MDRFKTKKKLYAGLGDFAKQMRGQEMRKKYSTGSQRLDEVAASQDAAVEAAEMPRKKPADLSLTIGVGDVAKDAEGWQAENEKALADIAEDEEMAKWMAKQKG